MNIQIDHLSHTYPGKPPRAALHDIQLEVPQGQFCAILGPSGCGKSTLLRLAAGLLQPSAGRVRLTGSRPNGPPPSGASPGWPNLRRFFPG